MYLKYTTFYELGTANGVRPPQHAPLQSYYAAYICWHRIKSAFVVPPMTSTPKRLGLCGVIQSWRGVEGLIKHKYNYRQIESKHITHSALVINPAYQQSMLTQSRTTRTTRRSPRRWQLVDPTKDVAGYSSGCLYKNSVTRTVADCD